MAAIFYGRISPSLSKIWANNYIMHGSAAAFLRSLNGGLWGVYFNLLHLPALTAGGGQLLLLLVLLGPLGVRCRPQRRHARPRLHHGSGRVRRHSEAHIAPLGTGRTDEYLYPALLLLLASGIVRLWAACATVSVTKDATWRERRGGGGGGRGCGPDRRRDRDHRALPRVRGADPCGGDLATAQPTDHIVVGELADTRGRTTRTTRSASAWSGLEHVLHRGQPDLRCSSSPPRGTRAVRTRPAGPTSYAPTAGCGSWSPPALTQPHVRRLLADGWHPVRRLTVTGGAAILLERSPG